MEMKINISKENWDFLQNLMENINTQDSRGTASPYYFTNMSGKAHDFSCGMKANP